MAGLADILTNSRPGDVLVVAFAGKKRSVTGTSVTENHVYTSSGRVRPGHRAGGSFWMHRGEVYFQPTPQQQMCRVDSVRRVAAVATEWVH